MITEYEDWLGGLCRTFWLKPDEIPEIIVGALTLRNIILWLRLHSMNNIGEFHGILNKEHRNIVTDEVPDTLVGVELDSKPSNIANSVLEQFVSMLEGNMAIEIIITALPREPWTVLNLTKTGVVLEESVKTGAWVYLAARLSKTLKYPCAAAPRAWTTRSGIRSWSNLWIFSLANWSSRRAGPAVDALEILSLLN